jgi:hypothetical protein
VGQSIVEDFRTTLRQYHEITNLLKENRIALETLQGKLQDKKKELQLTRDERNTLLEITK